MHQPQDARAFYHLSKGETPRPPEHPKTIPDQKSHPSHQATSSNPTERERNLPFQIQIAIEIETHQMVLLA
jgi:hypothetical protein